MAFRSGGALLALAVMSAGALTAQVADLSGTWVLNPEKSRWGGGAKPVNIMVTIEHREPFLSYSGTLVYAEGEDTRSFKFSGNIGAEHPARRSFGEGKLLIKRVDSRTLASEFKSNDGMWTETIRTTVSRDGRVMRRNIRREGPTGRLQWTEVYEKR